MSLLTAADRPAQTDRVIGPSTSVARSPVRDGATAMMPLVLAYVPFAMVVGATGADHGTAVACWAESWLVFGGSAQLASFRTLDAAGPAMAILTGLLVHARLLVYSAGLARTWSDQPRWFRAVAAGLIIDPTFAAGERHAAGCDDRADRRRYFLAAGLTLGFGWTSAVAIGAVVGSRLHGLDIEIVAPLCLIALVGDAMRSAGSRFVMIVAAVVGALSVTLPAGTGLLAAMIAGTGAGVAWERWSR